MTELQAELDEFICTLERDLPNTPTKERVLQALGALYLSLPDAEEENNAPKGGE